MITIHSVRVDGTNKDFARLVNTMEVDGLFHDLYVEVPAEYGQFFVTERADSLLVGLLLWAMKNGHDITCKIPITSELLYNLEVVLIPTLCKYDKSLSKISIFASDERLPVATASGVGTGMSLGVDCLNTIMNMSNSKYPGLKLTHLITVDNGVLGGRHHYFESGHEYAMQVLLKREQECADELGLPLVKVYSNIGDIVDFTSGEYASYYIAHIVYSLGKLFKTYFFSSDGKDYSSFSVVPQEGKFYSSNYDLLAMNCFSLQDGIRFYSEGGEKDRIEKLSAIAGYPLAQKYLHSCLMQSFNCGICLKCISNLLVFDAIDKLDCFRQVYDIDYYILHKDVYLEYLISEVTKNAKGYAAFLAPIYAKIRTSESCKIESIQQRLKFKNIIAYKRDLANSEMNCALLREALVDVGFINRVKCFFSAKGYRNIVLHGEDTDEFAIILLEIQSSIGISITYIVSNTLYDSTATMLRRGNHTYSSADAIIVCNTDYPKAILKQVSEGSLRPVHHIQEVFNCDNIVYNAYLQYTISNRDIEWLNKKQLVVWGAGTWGEHTLNCLKDMNISVCMLLDVNVRRKSIHVNNDVYDVEHPSRLLRLDPDDFHVIVAVRYATSVVSSLRKWGSREYKAAKRIFNSPLFN